MLSSKKFDTLALMKVSYSALDKSVHHTLSDNQSMIVVVRRLFFNLSFDMVVVDNY